MYSIAVLFGSREDFMSMFLSSLVFLGSSIRSGMVIEIDDLKI